MKKSYSLLIIMVLILLFSSLIIFVFEIKSLRSENIKNEYLFTQATLHEQFLIQLTEHIKQDTTIEKLEFEEGLFTLKVTQSATQFELEVSANDYPIRLHKTIII